MKQSSNTDDLVIPDHLMVTATPVTTEHQNNSFLLFDSNENEENDLSWIPIFDSADMHFKASIATELCRRNISCCATRVRDTSHNPLGHRRRPIPRFLLPDKRRAGGHFLVRAVGCEAVPDEV